MPSALSSQRSDASEKECTMTLTTITTVTTGFGTLQGALDHGVVAFRGISTPSRQLDRCGSRRQRD
jgi:hypothetical protein